MKVMAHNGIPVLLHVHNSPLNKSSHVSIISEYQVRDYGLIIDSCSTRHRKAHNKYGSQRFQLNDVIHSKFVDIGALMALEVLPYKEGDDEIYDIIDITEASVPWDPRKFRDPEYDINSVRVKE